MPDIILEEYFGLVDIQITDGVLDVGLLWLDARAPAFIDIPELGRITIPEDLRYRRNSTLIPNIKLNYVP
jgi:hypothetical protein